MACQVGGVRVDPMVNQMAYLKVNIIHDKSASASGGARCTDQQRDAQKNYVSMPRWQQATPLALMY